MSEVATAPAANATPKKAKGKATATGGKKPKAKSSHPKTSDMVNAAIENLKERGGSSLQAIKKYISANYKVDADKMAPFIRKYLKGAVTNGALVQTKGKGASGSFKLVAGEKSKAIKTVKPKVTASKAKTSATKTGAVKKSAAAAPKKASSKPKVAKPPSPSKSKKTTKAPTKKPKTPKREKVWVAKSSAKAAPKKK